MHLSKFKRIFFQKGKLNNVYLASFKKQLFSVKYDKELCIISFFFFLTAYVFNPSIPLIKEIKFFQYIYVYFLDLK